MNPESVPCLFSPSQLEVPLFETAKEKMMVLAKAVTDPDSANQETKFVQDAVVQLLKARHVLKCSYVYGYYLEETGFKKPIFEFMQVCRRVSFSVFRWSETCITAMPFSSLSLT